jgi:hypothetical protein
MSAVNSIKRLFKARPRQKDGKRKQTKLEDKNSDNDSFGSPNDQDDDSIYDSIYDIAPFFEKI